MDDFEPTCCAVCGELSEPYWLCAECEADRDDERFCPHGGTYCNCNDCFAAGDLAYDAERERR